MKKIIILLIISVPILSGCSLESSIKYECKEKVIKIDTICEGIDGCNYTYYLENGAVVSGQISPLKQDAEGRLCNVKIIN